MSAVPLSKPVRWANECCPHFTVAERVTTHEVSAEVRMRSWSMMLLAV